MVVMGVFGDSVSGLCTLNMGKFGIGWVLCKGLARHGALASIYEFKDFLELWEKIRWN